MERLIIYVWFPWLATERLRQTGESDGQQTLVLTSRYQGADYVDALCRRGHRRGLQIGMRLADARALCPDLVSRDSAPAADARDLHHLALWARRYSPLTAPDQGAVNSGTGKSGTGKSGIGAMTASAIARDGNGIWLDVAGATHLHGGVRPLLADMLWRLRRAGLRARLGVASSCGAAWGLARYGRVQSRLPSPDRKTTTRVTAALLTPLPLAALRLDRRTVAAMATAGLRHIGDILGMPRAPLANRFGSQLIERLDAALGHINESFAPIALQRPLLAVLNFAEPVAAPDDIKATIHRLAEDIAEILHQNGLATRRLRLGWQRVDGTVQVHDTHLSRPGRDASAFHRLLADAGEAINPEFGLESAWMEAHGCSPQSPLCRRFDEGLTTAESYASLVDRLVARLGYGTVLRLRPRACWQPEAAQYMALPDMEAVPASGTTTATATTTDPDDMFTADGWPAQLATAAPRPIRLLSHPQPVAVTALLPDHPPALFVWRKKTHRISRASGPERIAPEWWTAPSGTRTRDYFRLQDETGARFWVYREGLPERGEDINWFLHGFFA
jgi:protein ImuB